MPLASKPVDAAQIQIFGGDDVIRQLGSDPRRSQTRRVFVHSASRARGDSRSVFQVALGTPAKNVVAVSVPEVHIARTQPAIHEANNTLAVFVEGMSPVSTSLFYTAASVSFDFDPASATAELQRALNAAMPGTFIVTDTSIALDPGLVSPPSSFELAGPLTLVRALRLERVSSVEYSWELDPQKEAVIFLHIKSIPGSFSGAGPSNTNGGVTELQGPIGAVCSISLPVGDSPVSVQPVGGVVLSAPISKVAALQMTLVNMDGTKYLARSDWSCTIELFGQ